MARADLYKTISYTGSSGKSAKMHKFKAGSNVFRILPPLPNSGLKGNDFGVFHRVHWGYGITGKGAEGQDVTFPKPFFCQFEQDNKTKQVRVPCAHCAKIEENANALTVAKAEALQRGMSDAETKAHISVFTERQKRFSVEKKVYFNDLDSDGTLGYRKVSYATYKQLKDLMSTLAQDGIDPLHPDQGVWFEMVKTGEGFMTRYTDPQVVTERNGRTMEIKPAPLTDEQLEAAQSECPNLYTGVQVLSLSPTQIQLLADSNGTNEEVEAILGITQQAEAPAAPAPAPVAAKPVAKPAAVPTDKKAALLAQLAALEAEAAAEAAPKAEEVVDPEVAALEAKLAAAKAAKAAKGPIVAAAKPQTVATPVAPAVPDAQDSEVEDLLNKFRQQSVS